MKNLAINAIEEVWEVAEETIIGTYKTTYGKGINEAFADIAENEGYLYIDACEAYRHYMRNIQEETDLGSYIGFTAEDVRKDFAEWYEKSEMFSEITLADLKEFME
ncbi:hypothetical protein [Kineothrix sp. MB12-C1]|uniref:hypothetical protein n=1 Tax=Kineothrix sp. MB12-C1 TaxID=3070215 RepID=UPI0027D23695|nr:hypothetical protein [Kineothrix sp. MB12-C1]WMC91275.1 hypothetical protein RBB56_10300 [Kineothrix sp. MB12-C1]